MENARDTFYIALRNRINALNPTRTILLRGVSRPGVVVEANESVVVCPQAGVFVLRWTGMIVNAGQAMPLAEQVCEIAYETEGTFAAGGLDRGRALAEMDRELMAALQAGNTQKLDYTKTPPVSMGTKVFWTMPAFSDVVTTRDRLSRVAKVTVCSYEEAGEQ